MLATCMLVADSKLTSEPPAVKLGGATMLILCSPLFGESVAVRRPIRNKPFRLTDVRSQREEEPGLCPSLGDTMSSVSPPALIYLRK